MAVRIPDTSSNEHLSHKLTCRSTKSSQCRAWELARCQNQRPQPVRCTSPSPCKTSSRSLKTVIVRVRTRRARLEEAPGARLPWSWASRTFRSRASPSLICTSARTTRASSPRSKKTQEVARPLTSTLSTRPANSRTTSPTTGMPV